MGLGLASRIDRLESRRDPERRYVDIAVQFHVVELRDDELYWTDIASRVYGGRWDTKRLEYADEAENVLHMECSQIQFEYVESTSRVTEISGGRGLGKSYSGLLVATKNVCNRPFIDGRVVSPTRELFVIQWDKYVPLMLETGWLLGGEDGVQEARHELWFQNGVVVQFKSAHKPGRLASWGGGWAVCDESQDITDKAVSKLLYCLREGHGFWQLYHQLTPAPGDALKRHKKHVATAAERPDDARVLHAPSRANIFVDQDVFDYAARDQSREEYLIEATGDWSVVEQLEEADAPRPVFPVLAEEWKRYQEGEENIAHAWQPDDFWRDITQEVVRAKLGAGHSQRFIAGLDPGTNVPNCCTVWKVYQRRGQLDAPWTWVAWDFFEELGHCGHMGEALIDSGYSPEKVVIVPDFTSWSRAYQRRADGSGKAGKGEFGRAAARMLQQLKFTVVRRPNPRVPVSVGDVHAKLDPAAGPVRMFFRLPETVRLFSNMAEVIWDGAGKNFDPSVPNDPTDSGRYPVSMFDPAARLSTDAGGVRLIGPDGSVREAR